jgi:hypothetical protein
MDLERDLRSALRRKDPPPGFAGRVMARIEPRQVKKAPPRWVPWAAAAALLVSAGGGAMYRHEQQRVQGEQAKEQILLALRITGTQLEHVRAKMRPVSNQENQ